MLNRKTPDTLAVNLTIKAPTGESDTVEVIFYNRNDDEIEAKNKELLASGKLTEEQDFRWLTREEFLFLVKEFNGQVPSHEGIMELERNWPGAAIGVLHKYREARTVQVVKN